MIITIDGYAGTGKTTAARRLADALGFRLLNTGGMYRAAALALARRGFRLDAEPRDAAAVAAAVAHFTFDMPADAVFLDGEEYTRAIRTEEAGWGASRIGTFPEVRRKLQAEQRRIALGRDYVCEGRDQGTTVFPDAPVKFFLWASPEVRAERRLEQLRSQNLPASRVEVFAQIVARDRQDESRAIDPLAPAADAVRIDTTTLSTDAVLARMLEVTRPWRR